MRWFLNGFSSAISGRKGTLISLYFPGLRKEPLFQPSQRDIYERLTSLVGCAKCPGKTHSHAQRSAVSIDFGRDAWAGCERYERSLAYNILFFIIHVQRLSNVLLVMTIDTYASFLRSSTQGLSNEEENNKKPTTPTAQTIKIHRSLSAFYENA